jgi:hypothetical protein
MPTSFVGEDPEWHADTSDGGAKDFTAAWRQEQTLAEALRQENTAGFRAFLDDGIQRILRGER